MKKFEYRVVLADNKPEGTAPTIEHILHQEGRNGWEFVRSSREEYPTDQQKNNQVMLILKRLVG